MRPGALPLVPEPITPRARLITLCCAAAPDGEYSAVFARGRLDAQLVEDVLDVRVHRFHADAERSRDAEVRSPLCHQLEHLGLARGERCRRVCARWRDAIRRDTTSGSTTEPPASDRAHRVGQCRAVPDPVLEQVAGRSSGCRGPGRPGSGWHTSTAAVRRRCCRLPAAPREPGSPRRCGTAACGCRARPRRQHPRSRRGHGSAARRLEQPRRTSHPAAASSWQMPSRISGASSATTTPGRLLAHASVRLRDGRPTPGCRSGRW